MGWKQNNWNITFQSMSILDFKEDTFQFMHIKDTGGIWVEFAELKEDKVPENEPIGKSVLFQISFSKDVWKLAEAKKWFKKNGQMIDDKIALKGAAIDSIDIIQAVRHDRTVLANTKVTDQGYLQTNAVLTRTGIFKYMNSDGSIRKELRLPAEVFNKDSMDSFANLAVTDDHPPELLTAENTSKYSKGHTFPEVKKDGDFLTTSLLITDAKTIQKVNDGKQELSNGYLCGLEMSSGVWNGKKYDAIQRNIRGNHVAIVTKGRAGRNARLTLDSGEITDFAEMVESDLNKDDSYNNTKGKVKMAKLKIDGVEIEIDDSIVSVVSTGLEKRDTKIVVLETAAVESKTKEDTLQAKVDSQDAEIKQVKEDTPKEDDLAKIVNDRANEKVVLLAVASKLLKEDELKELEGKSDQDIKRVCIAADPMLSDIKLDDKPEAYIDAMFDTATANSDNRKDKADKQTKDVGTAKTVNTDTEISSDQARLDMIEIIKARSREVGKGAE